MNIPDEFVKKFIQIVEINKYNNDEIVCKKGEPLRHLVGSLKGRINGVEAGNFANEDLFLLQKDDKNFTLEENLKKYGKGNVFLLEIAKIESILKIDLLESLRNSNNIFEHFESTLSVPNEKLVSKRTNTNALLSDLIYERKLGEGQFGKVYLVRDRKNDERYALKCIKKKEVISLNMEEFVLAEKNILADLDHPFIVKF